MANFIIRWLDASDSPNRCVGGQPPCLLLGVKLPRLQRGDAAESDPYRKLSLRWPDMPTSADLHTTR
jgi:hypothetical protein